MKIPIPVQVPIAIPLSVSITIPFLVQVPISISVISVTVPILMPLLDASSNPKVQITSSSRGRPACEFDWCIAFKKGGRWPWFWLATVLHGLFSDNFWHIVLPDYDNFWHSQAPIMFYAARLPLHILFLYPAFIYNAAYAVSRLNLPFYSEPFAVGLLTVLIDIPYDIVAVKFVHWTWHDTDPNIFDRHYWVPWNSYYFHATFAASLYFFFHATRKMSSSIKVDKWESAGVKHELRSLLLASFLGMPGGVLMFLPIYHPLHDMFGIHSEVTFFLLLAIFVAMILPGLAGEREKIKTRLTTIDYVLLAQLAIHYFIYWAFVVWGHPEKEWSMGLHEPVGPCDQTTHLTTIFGQNLMKRKFLCIENYDEGYFDFHCTGGQLPKHGARWYVICGTPFSNRMEYITVLTTILVLAAGVFYTIYFKLSKTEAPNKKYKTK